MLDKYHHYQFSYHVIIIASNGLKAWQLRETVWHSRGLFRSPLPVCGPSSVKSTA